MTDPQNWHAPTGDAYDRPRYGEYAPPPASGAPQAWGPPPAWTPPPRPGLLPLRPLGFGSLLWAPFQVLRRNPKATFGSALLVQGAILLVTLLIVGPVTVLALGRVDSAPLADRDAVQAGANLTIVLSAIVPILLSVIASAMLQGVIVVEVSRAMLGQKLRLGQLWRAAGRRLWPLALWSAILSGALLLGLAIVAGVVVVFVLLGGAGVVFGIVFGILGALGILALSAWLATKTSLVPSLIVLERLGIGAAIARSWSLTRGYFWRTLGVQFLVAAIVNIVSQIVSTPLSLLGGVAVSLIDPTGAIDSWIPVIVLYVLTILLSLVLGAVAAVVQSGTTALIYIDLRMRKEGLDLDLQRFVESSPGNDAADPYLVPAGRMPAAPQS
ncbi:MULTISPECIES: hypothetical protein [Cryobacterium]|uniref:DUF7847 domain-containing protein n=1 Tax=Cryobacterium glucosi TaxID=1259175 RepID=A0ABY2ILN8_9MICO|nr:MULTISPECIES: hypothetical protein [Cryobacterium]TFB97107.1 hypothetical protein E3O39_09060 [Cryobacterium sp. MDB2-A-1]TFC08856.1 hypothetical protein E3O35_15885 [Cryobacterium sp. MDB2-A-2]TFC18526.1 hypothetical protein E3O46_13775 [Cryobacterium glucosi]TFC19318.1 hypothetical protein E3O51_06970 [Cryobacterium sp. MDB2-10]